jgi:hypothetical protein
MPEAPVDLLLPADAMVAGAARQDMLRQMRFNPFTACGIVGAGCFIIAYFATVQGWMSLRDWRFPAANLLGALLLLVSLYDAWNLPSVVIEAFWAAISLYGIVRSRRDGGPSSR